MKYRISILFIMCTMTSTLRADSTNLQATISHLEGRGVGYNRGYTTAELFVMPGWLGNENIYPFIDLRGHGFDNRKLAANAGLGIRMQSINNYCLGINFYYDARQAYHKNFDELGRTFQQVGLGLESLGPDFDLRFNFYQPVGKKKWHFKQIWVDDDNIQNTHEKRKIAWSEPGFDAEIGRCVDQGNFGSCFGCNVGWWAYAAAGTYFFKHPGNKKNIWGAKFRLTANISRYLSFELRTSYDRVSNGIVQLKLGINIPICLGKEMDCCLLTPVERVEIMPLFWKRDLAIYETDDIVQQL